jgi:hypothetical protein
MRYVGAVAMIALALSPVVAVRQAEAQIPPHYPGTICFTPQFWCWANPPGQPGSPCGCPSPYGWIPGRYG